MILNKTGEDNWSVQYSLRETPSFKYSVSFNKNIDSIKITKKADWEGNESFILTSQDLKNITDTLNAVRSIQRESKPRKIPDLQKKLITLMNSLKEMERIA